MVILLLVLAALIPKKSVQAEVYTDATPAEVWQALMDTASYGEWNPIFTAVRGRFREGGTMGLTMTLEGGSSSELETQVMVLETDRLLNQTAGIPGVLTANHSWIIEPTAQGTRVIQFETYRGIGVWFYDPSYVQVLYQQGLDALKTRLQSSPAALSES